METSPKKINPLDKTEFLREKKEKCLQLYIEGRLTLKRISEQEHVVLSTLKSWVYREDWVHLREKADKISQRTLFNQYKKKIEENSKNILDASILISKSCLEYFEHHLENENKKQEFFAESSFAETSKLLKVATDLQKSVFPNSNEMMSERILDQVEEINKNLAKGIIQEEDQE